MKIAQENAIYLRALIKTKGIKTIQELASDPEAVSQINMYLAIAIVVILVIAGIATYLVAVVVSNPLVDLANSADKIAKGEINIEIPHKGIQR